MTSIPYDAGNRTAVELASPWLMKKAGTNRKRTGYHERVRAIAPAMICIITPMTHPIMISIVP
jgi:hypothetical protein